VTSCAGFPLNDQLYQMIIRRYSDECGNLDFDNYIGCLVRLDAMCRKSGPEPNLVVRIRIRIRIRVRNGFIAFVASKECAFVQSVPNFDHQTASEVAHLKSEGRFVLLLQRCVVEDIAGISVVNDDCVSLL